MPQENDRVVFLPFGKVIKLLGNPKRGIQFGSIGVESNEPV
jgi:hypothetical protein